MPTYGGGVFEPERRDDDIVLEANELEEKDCCAFWCLHAVPSVLFLKRALRPSQVVV